jgi:uncharacterized caspase-like protein
MVSSGYAITKEDTVSGQPTLWDTANGRLIRAFDGGDVRSVAVAGKRVLSGDQKGYIKLWDMETGHLIHTLDKHSGPVKAVAFSPDGGRIISGAGDGRIGLWDTISGRLIWLVEAHTKEITSVAFSRDGERVLSGSSDATTKLWDVQTGQPIRTFEGASLVLSVTFSPDGTRVLTGDYDGRITLWDAIVGQSLRIFDGHLGPVKLIAFSGERIISGSEDGTVRVWNSLTGGLLAILVADSHEGKSVAHSSPSADNFGSGDGKWLAMTPTGFFAKGHGGDEILSIVRGYEVTAVQQVHQSLFNPDLVREALAGDPTGEVAEATKVINLEKVLDSGPAPSVAITSPAAGSQSDGDLVEVTARIEDRGKGVGRIEWRVNSITAAVGAKRAVGDRPVYTPLHPLALDPGDNTIEVVAYNEKNLLASLPARTTVKYTEPANKTKPRLHILAIGIDRYVDAKLAPPLDLAETDAKAFAESMQKAGAGLYRDVPPPTLILGKDATRANLERTIDRIAAKIQPRDTFILFASGHGASWKGRFYLIPQDHRGGWANMAEGAIGQDQLQDWLANRIKARKAIILLDNCESGALVAGHGRSRIDDSPTSEAAVGRLHEATGRPVLTGAAAGKPALEGAVDAKGETHGVFTLALLSALREGDTNGNGLIELSELVAYVQRAVPNIAAGVDDEGKPGKQAARFGSRGEDFVVARRLQ